jgi:hypothetical protein
MVAWQHWTEWKGIGAVYLGKDCCIVSLYCSEHYRRLGKKGRYPQHFQTEWQVVYESQYSDPTRLVANEAFEAVIRKLTIFLSFIA